MENLGFLFAAYSATWAVLFLYVYSLWRKQNRIAEEIRRLKAKVGVKEQKVRVSELPGKPKSNS